MAYLGLRRLRSVNPQYLTKALHYEVLKLNYSGGGEGIRTPGTLRYI